MGVAAGRIKLISLPQGETKGYSLEDPIPSRKLTSLEFAHRILEKKKFRNFSSLIEVAMFFGSVSSVNCKKKYQYYTFSTQHSTRQRKWIDSNIPYPEKVFLVDQCCKSIGEYLHRMSAHHRTFEALISIETYVGICIIKGECCENMLGRMLVR